MICSYLTELVNLRATPVENGPSAARRGRYSGACQRELQSADPRRLRHSARAVKVLNSPEAERASHGWRIEVEYSNTFWRPLPPELVSCHRYPKAKVVTVVTRKPFDFNAVLSVTTSPVRFAESL
jgi:hypothetical protein